MPYNQIALYRNCHEHTLMRRYSTCSTYVLFTSTGCVVHICTLVYEIFVFMHSDLSTTVSILEDETLLATRYTAYTVLVSTKNAHSMVLPIPFVFDAY